MDAPMDAPTNTSTPRWSRWLKIVYAIGYALILIFAAGILVWGHVLEDEQWRGTAAGRQQLHSVDTP